MVCVCFPSGVGDSADVLGFERTRTMQTEKRGNTLCYVECAPRVHVSYTSVYMLITKVVASYSKEAESVRCSLQNGKFNLCPCVQKS